jgi:hypothetical protein
MKRRTTTSFKECCRVYEESLRIPGASFATRACAKADQASAAIPPARGKVAGQGESFGNRVRVVNTFQCLGHPRTGAEEFRTMFGRASRNLGSYFKNRLQEIVVVYGPGEFRNRAECFFANGRRESHLPQAQLDDCSLQRRGKTRKAVTPSAKNPAADSKSLIAKRRPHVAHDRSSLG